MPCAETARSTAGPKAGSPRRWRTEGAARLRWLRALWSRHHLAAALAGARPLARIEVAVGLGHRVGAVVVDDELLFVEQGVTPGAEPLEAVDLAGAPLALDDEGEGIGGKAR